MLIVIVNLNFYKFPIECAFFFTSEWLQFEMRIHSENFQLILHNDQITGGRDGNSARSFVSYKPAKSSPTFGVMESNGCIFVSALGWIIRRSLFNGHNLEEKKRLIPFSKSIYYAVTN